MTSMYTALSDLDYYEGFGYDKQPEPEEAPAAAPPPRPFSPTQANTLIDCAAKWYYCYEAKLPERPSGALALGSAVHYALGAGYTWKRAEHANPDPDFLLPCFEHQLAQKLRDVDLTAKNSADQLRETGALIITLYARDVMPHVTPVEIEKPVRGHIAGVPVRGYIDLIDIEGRVIDLKTAARRPSNGVSAEHTLQLTTYAMLDGRDEGRLHIMTKTKDPAFIQHTLPIGPPERKYAETMYSMAADAAASGLYLPRRTSNLCSRRYCAFWQHCEADHGGKVRA